MHMKHFRRAGIAATIALFGAGSLFGGPIWNVIDLGSLGGSNAQAFAVNASGVAAGSASTPFGYNHAISSTGAGIADLTINSSAAEGIASGINQAGIVVGTQFINGQAFAAEWSNGAVNSLAGAGSYALAINDSGEIAGSLTSGNGQGHAFVGTPGALNDLGVLPGGTWSSAYAINGTGDAAGYGNTASGAFRGFTWSPGGGYSELGTFGGANSYAMAINDAGVAAGSAQLANGALHAFISIGGNLLDLGTLGGLNSYAYGINDAGEVVGDSMLAGSGGPHAFLYENGVMIDLNSLIDPSSGWTLTVAYAINASGEIAGSGILNGVEHAFLLDDSPGSDGVATVALNTTVTPEPGTFALVLMCLTVVASARFRSRARLVPLPLARRRRLPRSSAQRR